MTHPGKLQGDLFAECGEWIWEQLQEEGFQLAGELVDLILETERELGIQARPLDEIARTLDDEFTRPRDSRGGMFFGSLGGSSFVVC